MARFNAFAACCLCLALMSGAMAARDLRGYGTDSSPYKYSPSPVNTYQPGTYTPTGVSYPICTLSPPPFEVNRLDKSAGYGDFTTCFDLSAKGYKGYDLAALQLVVSDKCYDHVKSVTFGGKKYEPELTQYTNEKNIGVKIGGKSLVTFKSLYTPVKVCITLKDACANADSLYNIITYFPVYSANCATTSLYNPTPSPYSYTPKSYPSPVYTPTYKSPSPVYTPTYKSPSPAYVQPSPSPVYERPSPVYTPVYKSPSPVYVQPSPSPVYESQGPVYTPVYKSPSPVYVQPSPSPVYERPSPVYTPVYESPSPVYVQPSPSPVYESPSPVYTPVYESPSPVYVQPSPSPVYESPSPVYTPVYESPSPVYKSPSPAYTY